MTNQSNLKPSLGKDLDLKAKVNHRGNLKRENLKGQANPKGPLKTHPQDALSKSNLVDQLRSQIRSAETVGRIPDEVRISSGCSAIDRLLPGNGYQRGTLIQWLTSGGHGADYLSLLVARQACADGGALVVFDPLNQFYPPAVAAIGINLDNLIVLRAPHSPTTSTGHRSLASDNTGSRGRPAAKADSDELQNDLLWSIDQALRCPAVAAVWGPIDHINERWFRRFQLSAESSGCLGLFVQPIHAARQPSWAEVQWIVSHDDRSLSNKNVTAGKEVSSELDHANETARVSQAPSHNETARRVSKVPSHNVTAGNSPGRKSGKSPTKNHESPEGTAGNQNSNNLNLTQGNHSCRTSGTQNKNATKTWDSRPMLSPAVPSALNQDTSGFRSARPPANRCQPSVTKHSNDQEHSNDQQVRLQLTRCRGTQTGKAVNLSINTITGNVQPARRDHESHQRNQIGRTSTIHGHQTRPATG